MNIVTKVNLHKYKSHLDFMQPTKVILKTISENCRPLLSQSKAGNLVVEDGMLVTALKEGGSLLIYSF